MRGDTGRVVTTRELPARFTPLQTASGSQRVLVFVVGSLLWLVAITLVALVIVGSRAVGVGLIVMLVAFGFGLALSVIGRRRRLGEEREAGIREP
jgi:hypothetical protein